MAIFSLRFRDSFNFSSLNFKIKVKGPGQNFSAIFFESLSNSTISEATSIE